MKTAPRKSFRAINFKVNSFPQSDTTTEKSHTRAHHRFYLTFDGRTRSDFNLLAGCVRTAPKKKKRKNKAKVETQEGNSHIYCEFFHHYFESWQTHKVAQPGHMSIKLNTRLASYLNDKCTGLWVDEGENCGRVCRTLSTTSCLWCPVTSVSKLRKCVQCDFECIYMYLSPVCKSIYVYLSLFSKIFTYIWDKLTRFRPELSLVG